MSSGPITRSHSSMGTTNIIGPNTFIMSQGDIPYSFMAATLAEVVEAAPGGERPRFVAAATGEDADMRGACHEADDDVNVAVVERFGAAASGAVGVARDHGVPFGGDGEETIGVGLVGRSQARELDEAVSVRGPVALAVVF